MHLHAFIFIFMNACIFMHSSHEDADECMRSKEMRSNEMNARIFMYSSHEDACKTDEDEDEYMHRHV